MKRPLKYLLNSLCIVVLSAGITHAMDWRDMEPQEEVQGEAADQSNIEKIVAIMKEMDLYNALISKVPDASKDDLNAAWALYNGDAGKGDLPKEIDQESIDKVEKAVEAKAQETYGSPSKNLPSELMVAILVSLSPQELLTARSVSTIWKQIADQVMIENLIKLGLIAPQDSKIAITDDQLALYRKFASNPNKGLAAVIVDRQGNKIFRTLTLKIVRTNDPDKVAVGKQFTIKIRLPGSLGKSYARPKAGDAEGMRNYQKLVKEEKERIQKRTEEAMKAPKYNLNNGDFIYLDNISDDMNYEDIQNSIKTMK